MAWLNSSMGLSPGGSSLCWVVFPELMRSNIRVCRRACKLRRPLPLRIRPQVGGQQPAEDLGEIGQKQRAHAGAKVLGIPGANGQSSEEHTSELQSRGHL